MKTMIMISLILSSVPVFAKDEEKSAGQRVEVAVVESGFEPSSVQVAAGSPVTLVVVRKTDNTCAKEISVPSKKLKKKLPLDKAVELKLGALKSGELKFVCGMDMLSGVVVFQ